MTKRSSETETFETETLPELAFAEPRLTEFESSRMAVQSAGAEDGFDSRCSETLSVPEKFAPVAVKVLPKGPVDGASEIVGVSTSNWTTGERRFELDPVKHM